MNLLESWIGDSSPEYSQGTEGEFSGHFIDSLEEQDALQHARTSEGSSGITIATMEELRIAIDLTKLSQVTSIQLASEDVGKRDFILVAEALASGQMSALVKLWLPATKLTEDSCAYICNGLTSHKFPSLSLIDFSHNGIGTRGVEALGRALQSGNLENLGFLSLGRAGIHDHDMAELASAFQHSTLSNLELLDLTGNSFTNVGMQSLAEVLKSGRLDSLEELRVAGCTKAISEESANALVSALMLNYWLTTEMEFEWHMFPALDRRRKELRNRNVRQKKISTVLVRPPQAPYMSTRLLWSPKVPVAFAKVYLCGNPKVGKTTLSHTLQRSFWESLKTWERRPRAVKRTRGIDVSQVSSRGTTCIPQWISSQQTKNPITLVVWDMAGQQDYHLVHHSFFPDLNFSEAKATTFVIVCTSEDLAQSARELRYWLQYIASSCYKCAQNLRRIFVVLNNIGGDKKVNGYARGWEKILQGERDHFKGLLEVETDLFLVDVRRRQNVLGLKKRLLEYSRNLLKDHKVPNLCHIIQTSLTAWSKQREQFPVVHWKTFVKDVQQLVAHCNEEIIEAGAKYLNEVGVLIHIDKKFPPEWGIIYQRLVVLDPNWICREVIGNIFLSVDMVNQTEGRHLFKGKVDRITGSILIVDFKKFFKSQLGEWSESQFDDLIVILLWLGLCYKGRDQNVFIPALIDKIGEPGDPWQSRSMREHQEDQWVMGFSIEWKENETTLAPLSLWHRFQVELAQTIKFNGAMPDNDFTAAKSFMTFTADYMNVLIRVNATEDLPTFEEISIYVKPIVIDKWDGDLRKQCQVDLANDLVEILLGLWETVCPAVEYLCKVVRPWLASQPKPGDQQRRNVEVSEVKKGVQEHGLGKKMNWIVGSRSEISLDQLLSTNDKKSVIKALETDICILKEAMREAVNLRIYPRLLSEEPKDTSHGTERCTLPTNVLADGEESAVASDWSDDRILHAAKEVQDNVMREVRDARREIVDKVDKVAKQLNDVNGLLREGFTKVLNEQKKVLRKLQGTERFFKEDKERPCPNLIYLGQKDSCVWATLKAALSPSVSVRLRFACEAMYNNYRPHEVKEQQGLDVSSLKASLKKITPWLKVSLTVLLISAKIGTNLILPDLQQLQKASSLLDGIVWATGFPKEELDKLVIEGMGLDANDPLWNPREVYGKSRESITDLISKLSPKGSYEQNFGLRRVCLNYSDGSLHGVAWICTDCLKRFRGFDLVREL